LSFERLEKKKGPSTDARNRVRWHGPSPSNGRSEGKRNNKFVILREGSHTRSKQRETWGVGDNSSGGVGGGGKTTRGGELVTGSKRKKDSIISEEIQNPNWGERKKIISSATKE